LHEERVRALPHMCGLQESVRSCRACHYVKIYEILSVKAEDAVTLRSPATSPVLQPPLWEEAL